MNRSAFIESRYLTQGGAREGYLAYYTTTNLLKVWPPLRELYEARFFEGRSSIRVLDLGTGTGAAVWGTMFFLQSHVSQVQDVVIVATDLLDENLRLVEKLGRTIVTKTKWPYRLSTHKIDLRKLPAVKEKYDLILLMNSLNEIDESHDEEVIRALANALASGGALVMIEPSAREQSRRAIRFRDHAVQLGFHVFAPCTRSGECPALKNVDDWCHTEVDWRRPNFIQWIDNEIGNVRLSLKSTYATMTPQDSNLSDYYLGKRDFLQVGRVVSQLFVEKGRSRFFLCNENGRREYVWMKRDKTNANATVRDIQRYDLLNVTGEEHRANDVRLGSNSFMNILSHASGAPNVDNSDVFE